MTEPLGLSAVDLATALRHRRLSAREVVAAHFDRIDAVNPAVNAVVTQVREQAHAQALTADERAATTAPEDLSPLHGIPMTHKDTHATAGIRTTSGSPLLADLVPRESEAVVERFQRAGVISTGKNNVPEFAAGSHTYNEVFGTTVNPSDTSRSAGGSSGGAAVTLATRIQPLADGSDMGGSLRNPAAFTNVVGFRATPGTVPHHPARDPRAWLGQKGAMARSVQDVILALSVIAGSDARSPVWCPTPAADFAALLAEPVGRAGAGPDRPLAGIRVAVTTDFGLDVPVEGEVAGVVLREARVFAELGAEVSEGCPRLRDADRVFDATRAFDMALALRELVAAHPGQVKDEVLWNVERGLALTPVDLMEVAVVAWTCCWPRPRRWCRSPRSGRGRGSWPAARWGPTSSGCARPRSSRRPGARRSRCPGGQARRTFSPLENTWGAPTASASAPSPAGVYSWMTVTECGSALSKASSTKASCGSPETSRRASNTETAISGRGSSCTIWARIRSSSTPGSFHMPFCSSSM